MCWTPSTMSPPSWRWPSCAGGRAFPSSPVWAPATRLDPSRLLIGDIADTAGCGCPLARVMRRELKKRGVTRQTVLYSTELPLPVSAGELAANGRHPPASMAFVPPAAGLLMASHAVRDLLGLLPSPK